MTEKEMAAQVAAENRAARLARLTAASRETSAKVRRLQRLREIASVIPRATIADLCELDRAYFQMAGPSARHWPVEKLREILLARTLRRIAALGAPPSRKRSHHSTLPPRNDPAAVPSAAPTL